MKILHYMLGLPPLHEGGLMIYARDLIYEQKEQGNDVSIIIPGRYNYFNHKSKIKYIQKISNIPIYFLNNPLPISFNGFQNPYSFISKRNTKNIFKYFKKNKFDILHIHSLIGLPKEFVEDAKSANVKIVFTSHDYFGLCPKIHFYKYDDTDCLENYDIRNCVYCNENSFIFSFVFDFDKINNRS